LQLIPSLAAKEIVFPLLLIALLAAGSAHAAACEAMVAPPKGPCLTIVAQMALKTPFFAV